MTVVQKLAVEAIKAATGWDSEPSAYGATLHRPNNTNMYVWWSRAAKWKCELRPHGWVGEGPTPEAAISAVFPRYRSHFTAVAADILPGFPRLEWHGPISSRRLCLVTGKLVTPILTVYADPPGNHWMLEIGRVVGPQSTRVDVLAAMAAHVAGLELPCVLPDFPEVSDVS